MNRCRLAIGLALPLFLSSCYLENQKLSESFTNQNELPAPLAAIANPHPSAEQETALLKLAQGAKGHVAAAIIDNGIDYMHPDLMPRVRFNVQGSKIIGVGHDFLGEDDWGSPNLIKPELFAFGAKAVTNGRIEGPINDPVASLVSYNDAFAQILDRELVAAQDRFKDTLLHKVTSKNLNLFGAHEIAILKTFPSANYEAYRSQNLLVGPKARESERLQNVYSDGIFRRVLDLDWVISDSEGVPAFWSPSQGLDSLWQLEGVQALYDVVMKSYREFTSQSDYEKAFQTYYDYRFSRELDKTSDPDTLKNSYVKALHAAWFERIYGTPYFDPFDQFLQNFCSDLDDASFKAFREGGMSAADRLALVRKSLGEYLDRFAKIDAYMKSLENASEDQRNQALQNEKNTAKTRQALEDALNARRPETLTCAYYARLDVPQIPALKRLAAVQNDPYTSSRSADSSHGSHVAGIIASQDPRIDVVPVRVITETVQAQKDKDQQLRDYFLKSFDEWTQIAAIRKGLVAAFDVHLSTADRAANEARKVAAVREIFAKDLETSFDGKRLDLNFIYEVIEALKYVGQHKIKVANISLGTNFLSQPARIDPNNLELKLDEKLKFFQYELYKYLVAQTVLRDAPKTLFVIAAGNDGGWLDGRSRSALPCDPSSAYFEAFAQNIGEIPNNTLTNILCVGSLGPEERLSSFTNIPLTQVPFVLSYGEAILSSVKMSDCSGATQDLEIKYGKAPSYPYLLSWDNATNMNKASQLAHELFENLGWLPSGLEGDALDKYLYKEAWRVNLYSTNHVPTLYSSLALLDCASSNPRKARMSGTSMATPAVTGYVARYLAEEMAAKKLSEEQMYDSPDFAPQKIVEAIMNKSPRYGGNSVVRDVRKITDIRGYMQSAPQKGLVPAGFYWLARRP